MPIPAGYVGFTVTQRVVLATCQNNYNNPAHSPSQGKLVATAIGIGNQGVPGWANGFSFYEFAILLNNMNGALPVPPGHTIVAKISTQKSRIVPCGVPRPASNRSYFEKFGANPLDIQAEFVGCDSVICYKRTAEYAIVPDPAPAVQPQGGPQGEYADVIALTPAQEAQLNNAITLRLEWEWEYDKCNNPPRTPTNTGTGSRSLRRPWIPIRAEPLLGQRPMRLSSQPPTRRTIMERHKEIIIRYEVLYQKISTIKGRELTIRVIESEASCPAEKPICKTFLLLTGDVPDLMFEGPRNERIPDVAGDTIRYGDFVIGFACKRHEIVVNGRTEEIGPVPSRHGMEFGPDGYMGIL